MRIRIESRCGIRRGRPRIPRTPSRAVNAMEEPLPTMAVTTRSRRSTDNPEDIAGLATARREDRGGVATPAGTALPDSRPKQTRVGRPTRRPLRSVVHRRFHRRTGGHVCETRFASATPRVRKPEDTFPDAAPTISPPPIRCRRSPPLHRQPAGQSPPPEEPSQWPSTWYRRPGHDPGRNRTSCCCWNST